ncbi:MAG TPA: T9SS type A sorting domain-containing protein [Flavobacterium sp.]|uniref:T9SS type A sorting domain-containing protein n=1 Tax=Flavobacterium sp. TaxID=239 RepID=UPI002B79CE7F|nr:T9SS type A sorting domain-containing protein [Flavobacterium sp.]HSD15151.1 T9SS type A sorting domain-containing protein [Flavobacterium sp.]
MKKILFFLLFINGMVQAQIVNIPDANFKAALVSSNCVDTNNNSYADADADTNDNGEIEVSEALAVQNLIVFNSNISSLEGIQSFANLISLSAGYNQITSFDGAGLNSLKTLLLYNNQLSVLDVSNLSMLEWLNCFENNLVSLNVVGLANLKYLDFNSNQVTSVSLAGLVSLEDLRCYANQLTALSLVGLNNLRSLSCGNNQLTSLNFSGLLNLQRVSCSNNMLTSLDFSGNPSMIDLSCSNNDLHSVNIKNGTNHWNPENYWGNNPNLTHVCIDEGEVSIVDSIVDQSSLSNTVVTTYCSFTPGGDYNTITGNVIYDVANNGCDATDLPQPFIKVKINDGTTEGASFVNSSGTYKFYTQAGNFTVTPDVENPTFFNFSPVNAVINFPNNNNNIATQHFCVTANGIHPDLEIVIAPVMPARPGFDAVYKIVYKNKGNQVLSQPYGINFFYNQNLMTFVSATLVPASQNLGGMSWNYSNLMPFESRSIEVTMHINAPTDVNPVNSGDVLQLTASILPMAGDATTQDNLFQFNQTVVNAFDPNDKYCLEGEIQSPVKIGDYLHYMINFENVGTAGAVNVVVKDVIDTARFDEKSLQVLSSSHPVEAKINGNVAEFVFQNINLAHNGGNGGGGHGNILLKIKTRQNLVSGDVATNKADIFFDYNAAIETNLASTIFQSLGVNENVIDNSVTVYPNPVKDVFTVKSANAIKSIQLFDVRGRILLTRVSNEVIESIDMASKTSGIYFVKITTTEGVKIEKILKS